VGASRTLTVASGTFSTTVPGHGHAGADHDSGSPTSMVLSSGTEAAYDGPGGNTGAAAHLDRIGTELWNNRAIGVHKTKPVIRVDASLPVIQRTRFEALLDLIRCQRAAGRLDD
jgi:hypothetical protein